MMWKFLFLSFIAFSIKAYEYLECDRIKEFATDEELSTYLAANGMRLKEASVSKHHLLTKLIVVL